MARGRMIDKVIILSRKINAISEGAENLYYRIYVNTDDFGLFHADPEILKGQIYTLRKDITIEIIQNRLDELIEIDDKKIKEIGTKYYYASVYRKDQNIYTTTSRAMAVLGIADNLEEAEKIAESAVSCIKGKLFHRKDVGTLKLLQKRINHMNFLLKNK